MQGRVTRELRADGVTATIYSYEAASGRLHSVTDPKQQVTTYAYALDDSLIGMTYTNGAIATPSVSFTYDPVYNRVVTMVDGTGTTGYTYQPAGALGAGQVASVDGPLTDDTITYAYDELGRVASRAINGIASSQTYDALGRVTSETNVLGAFTYGYVGVTGRLQLATYPNGQTSSYAYYDNLGDQRLQTIHHRKPDSSTLSKFDYTYDAAGNILTWQQQADSDAPTVWQYRYDRADQLASAVHQTTGATPSILKRYGYAYDPAGNRTSEQIDDQVTGAAHDSLNRLLTQTPGGLLAFQGTLNEPGRVTINGLPATVDATNQFQAAVPVTAGTNTITISAVDVSGNPSEAVYEVDQAGAARTSTYDANGNLASKTEGGSTWTYEFDARNILTRVLLNGTEVARFNYDGLGRRTEKVASGLTHRYVYDGPHAVEERLSGGTTGTIRYARGPGIDNWLGRQNADESTTYFVADHLGSIVRETDAAGVVTLTRTYDPWGNLDATSATVGGPAYTGRWWEPEIRLYDYRARFYDPTVGRFVSEDPAGFGAGDGNFFAYVANAPTSLLDPSGLSWRSNWNYLWDWVQGVGERARTYGPENLETQELMHSRGVNHLRDGFYSGGCKSQTNLNYGTVEAYWTTTVNPLTADWSNTAAEVGGVGGASIRNNGNGTATFTIPNTSGTHSFFLHVVPNLKASKGGMTNIEQNFQWTERLSARKCGCQR